MTTIKNKIAPIRAELLPRVATWIDNVRMLFFSSLLVVFAASCGNSGSEARNDMEKAADNASAKVDELKEDYKDNRDERMVKDIAELNAEELLLIADIQNKATNRDLKKAMAGMKTEHERLAGQITDYAASHQINLDNTIDNESPAADKTGAEWDKAAVERLMDKHEKSVDEVRKAAEKANDAGLKTWAANTLPLLQQHATSLQNWVAQTKM